MLQHILKSTYLDLMYYFRYTLSSKQKCTVPSVARKTSAAEGLKSGMDCGVPTVKPFERNRGNSALIQKANNVRMVGSVDENTGV